MSNPILNRIIPTSPPYLKRTMNELHLLLSEYKNVHLTQDDGASLIITVAVSGQTVKIYVPTGYPFRVPTLVINQTPYVHVLATNCTDELRKILKEHEIIYVFQPDESPVECLCCNSITCPNKWRPGLRLLELCKEVETIMVIKKRLVEKLMTKIIFTSYYRYCKNADLAEYISDFL
jgi:hypothetical protein